jgi:hypothetical protein
MRKPWIIVASACGLMALVVVAQHSGSGDSTGSSASKAQEALGSTPRAQRSGWLAVEDGGPGSGAARSGASGGSADGFDTGRESSSDWGLPGSGRRLGPGGGSNRTGFGVGYSGSDPIQAGANIPADTGLLAGGAAQLTGGGRGQTNASGSGTQELVKKTDNSTSTDAAKDDPNAPVLSLPFNDTTQPDKGESPVLDQNVKCGGVGEGCVFDTDSQYAIPDAANLSGDAGSISFCMQPQWSGTDPSNASLVTLHGNTWENRFTVFKNGENLRFLLWPNSGVETGVGAKISSWQPGTWHPVTATYGPDPTTGANTVSLYVDGMLIGQTPYDSEFKLPQVPLYIGSDYPAGSPAAQSSLMNFQAYNRVLAPSEALNFAASCPQ